MKFLSNFNTKLDKELYAKACAQFGDGKVLVIRRDPIYLWLKVILPSIGRIVGVCVLIWIELRLLDAGIIDRMMMLFASVLIAIVGIIGIFHACSKLMDYYMDFTIVTPRHIVSYDQSGIFTRSSISLDLTNLRSVNEQKGGILRSIFNYGTIVFFSEGDYGDMSGNNGTITLNYINYPRKVRETIMNIIKD